MLSVCEGGTCTYLQQILRSEVLQLCRSGRISWVDMVLAPSVAGLFKWRQFEPEVILLAVGWYLRFSLSYRDVEELLAERGLHADHVTVWRWVQRYAPELQRCLRRHLKPTNATFTGHLEGAEAIYNGARGNLVGIKTRLGNTPQHGVLFGMTGAGKSVIVADLLAQIGHRFGFRLIVEEGLSCSADPDSRLRADHRESERVFCFTETAIRKSVLCVEADGCCLPPTLVGPGEEP